MCAFLTVLRPQLSPQWEAHLACVRLFTVKNKPNHLVLGFLMAQEPVGTVRLYRVKAIPLRGRKRFALAAPRQGQKE